MRRTRFPSGRSPYRLRHPRKQRPLPRFLEIDELWENEKRLDAKRVGFAKADVMLQEQQRRRVEKHLALALGHVLQFRKIIAACQQPFFLQGAKSLRIPAAPPARMTTPSY